MTDGVTPGGQLRRLAQEAEDTEEIIQDLDASPETKYKLAEACAAVREARLKYETDRERSRRKTA